MKKVIFFFLKNFGILLLWIFSSCHSNDKHLSVNIKVGERSYSVQKKAREYIQEQNLNQTFSAYSIKIDIINNTDSTIKYWIMKCCWQDNFIFNTSGIYLDYCICDSNYPMLETLYPHQIKTIPGTIIFVSDSIKIKTGKIGFALLDDEEEFESYLFNRITMQVKDEKNIIWSNEFKIK